MPCVSTKDSDRDLDAGANTSSNCGRVWGVKPAACVLWINHRPSHSCYVDACGWVSGRPFPSQKEYWSRWVVWQRGWCVACKPRSRATRGRFYLFCILRCTC